MKRFFGGLLAILLLGGTALAEEVNKEEAYETCEHYIENNVSYFRGNFIPKGHRIEVVPKYIYKDQGNTHWLTWTFKSPVYLANETGVIKGTAGKTGAGCEVDKKTGAITYLSVSDKEIIRH